LCHGSSSLALPPKQLPPKQRSRPSALSGEAATEHREVGRAGRAFQSSTRSPGHSTTANQDSRSPFCLPILTSRPLQSRRKSLSMTSRRQTSPGHRLEGQAGLRLQRTVRRSKETVAQPSPQAPRHSTFPRMKPLDGLAPTKATTKQTESNDNPIPIIGHSFSLSGDRPESGARPSPLPSPSPASSKEITHGRSSHLTVKTCPAPCTHLQPHLFSSLARCDASAPAAPAPADTFLDPK
jgi:hypothetical protein